MIFVAACRAAAEVWHASPANYRQLLARLQPGDELRLASGEYLRGLPLHRLAGTAQRPVVIAGPAQGAPAVFLARAGSNTVSIVDAAHVVIRDLTLDGRGIPVDAVKCEGHATFAHHITLENLRIEGHGATQQTVGISTKCPAWGWVIRGNVIRGAGTGIYLGDSDGTDPFVDGLIEGNVVVESVGYNLQIKHQAPRPTLAGMPAGPSRTVIRDTVVLKLAPPREGAMPRPSVLVGHWPLSGPGASDRYVIEHNVFHGNPVESLFQGEGNIELRGNTFLAPDGDAIRIQPHNDVPREVLVEGNVVRARGAGIVLVPGEGAGAYRQVARDNAVIAAEPVSAGFAEGNAVEGKGAD